MEPSDADVFAALKQRQFADIYLQNAAGAGIAHGGFYRWISLPTLTTRLQPISPGEATGAEAERNATTNQP
jgi:hypothetical protein